MFEKNGPPQKSILRFQAQRPNRPSLAATFDAKCTATQRSPKLMLTALSLRPSQGRFITHG
jgi:hypothetical protein